MPSWHNLLFLFSNINFGSVVCGGDVFFFFLLSNFVWGLSNKGERGAGGLSNILPDL